MVFLTTTFCGITCRLELCFFIALRFVLLRILEKNKQQAEFLHTFFNQTAKC